MYIVSSISSGNTQHDVLIWLVCWFWGKKPNQHVHIWLVCLFRIKPKCFELWNFWVGNYTKKNVFNTNLILICYMWKIGDNVQTSPAILYFLHYSELPFLGKLYEIYIFVVNICLKDTNMCGRLKMIMYQHLLKNYNSSSYHFWENYTKHVFLLLYFCLKDTNICWRLKMILYQHLLKILYFPPLSRVSAGFYFCINNIDSPSLWWLPIISLKVCILYIR